MMNSVRFSVRWDGLILPLAMLLVTAAPKAHAASVAAGTLLTTRAEVTYNTAGVYARASSEPVTVKVDRSSVARVELGASSVAVSATQAIPCSITNEGNDVGDFRIAVTQSANTSAILVEDSNGDGVWQSTETKRVVFAAGLKPSSSLRCFLLVKPGTDVRPDDKGSATVFVAPSDAPEQEVSARVAVTYGNAAVRPAFTFTAATALNSSPTVRDGLAIVGSEGGVVYAVATRGNVAGTLAWRYPASGGIGAPVRGRVAVDSAGYFFTANNGWAYHLNKAGNEVWKTRVVPEGVELEAMPLVDADAVTLACGDGRVRRLDKRTGALLSESEPIGGGSLTTPAAPRPGELWMGAADGSLYTVNDAAGFTVLSAYNVSKRAVLATPYVDVVSGLVLSVTPEGNVYAMRIRSSEMVWGPIALGSAINGAPWVDSGSGVAYFAATNGMVFALDVRTGKTMHGYPVQFSNAGGFRNTPVVLPIPMESSVIFLASDDGKIIAAQTIDPTLRRTYDTGDPTASFLGSPALSGMRADDVMVAAASNGTLYGFLLDSLTP